MQWTKPATFLVALFLSSPGLAVCTNTIVLSGDVVTMTARDAVFNGDVLVCDTVIQEVKHQGATWNTTFDSSWARTVELGYIFPDLISQSGWQQRSRKNNQLYSKQLTNSGSLDEGCLDIGRLFVRASWSIPAMK